MSAYNNLPEILQKEWNAVNQYSTTKTKDSVFEDFKIQYDNFEGKTIEEFITMPKVVYTEWTNWKYTKRYYTSFNNKTLTVVWNEFKDFWQYDSEESKVMFKEMEFLSHDMIMEWRMKYNFEYTHIYEDYNAKYEDLVKKSKSQLWEEFGDIWEIDFSNYNENKYNEMRDYVSEIQCEGGEEFFGFCEDANYHSFDSYSMLEQFNICKDYDRVDEY